MAASDRLTGSGLRVLYRASTGTPATDERLLTIDHTSFSWNRQTDTVDVTAGNETARYEKPTIESLDWSIMMFDSNPAYLDEFKPMTSGIFSVYKNGVVHTVTISGSPTGGTFTITVNGQTTAGIAFDATGATVQTALEALGAITAGDVTVTGAAGGPYTLTWNVDTGTTYPVSISADGAGLTGGSTPAATLTYTNGSFSFNGLITGLSSDASFDGAIEIDMSGVRVGEMIVDF